MMNTTLRAAAALVLFLTLAAPIAGAQPAPSAQVTLGGRSTTTYSCGASPAGACAYLLYTSDCKEAPVKNGYPSLVCTHAVAAEFTLKPGESKTFHDLPPSVKQCQPRNGKLVFPDCMR